MSELMNYRAYSDASIRNNKIGIGYIIKTPDKQEIIYKYSQEIDIDHNITRSNLVEIAEIKALNMCLEKLIELKIKKVKIRSDCKNVLRWIKGRTQPRRRYIPYIETTRELMQHFDRVTVRWIPRDFNSEADRLSREVTA